MNDKTLNSSAAGWVIDVTHRNDLGERFYVCLEDPYAALLVVSQSLKIGRGDCIQVSRRLSKRHAKLLILKPGEVRAI
jgi:hypothetical protein